MKTHHIVKSYDLDLKNLQLTFRDMAEKTENQLAQALRALEKQDAQLAETVAAADGEIDRMEGLIDQMAVQILALRQPVALDLRIVIACLKMANHLERMADYAANISRRVLALNAHNTQESPPPLLFRMGDLVCEMLAQVRHAFRAQDPEIVKKMWDQDMEVDRLYEEFFGELLTHMANDPTRISLCTHYLFIAKNLERFGDHATNLSEVIAVMVKGKPMVDSRPLASGRSE